MCKLLKMHQLSSSSSQHPLVISWLITVVVVAVMIIPSTVLCGHMKIPAVKEETNERRIQKFNKATPKQQEEMQRYLNDLLRQETPLSELIIPYSETYQFEEEKKSDRVAKENKDISNLVNITASVEISHFGDSDTLPPPLPVEILKFELADAAIPNKETQELIKQGHVRSAKATAGKRSIHNRRSTKPVNLKTIRHRTKRSSNRSTQSKGLKKIKKDMTGSESIEIHVKYPASRSKTGHSTIKSIKDFPIDVQNLINSVFKQENSEISTVNSSKRHQRTNNNNNNNNYYQWWKQQQEHALPVSVEPTITSYSYPQVTDSITPSSHIQDLKDMNNFNDEYLEKNTNFRIEVPSDTQFQSSHDVLEDENQLLKQNIQIKNKIRPQDSTAPVLFPLGARIPLPKSNNTFTFLSKTYYPQSNSIALQQKSGGEQKGSGEYSISTGFSSQSISIEDIQKFYSDPNIFPPIPGYYSKKQYTPITESHTDEEELLPVQAEPILPVPLPPPPPPTSPPIHQQVHTPVAVLSAKPSPVFFFAAPINQISNLPSTTSEPVIYNSYPNSQLLDHHYYDQKPIQQQKDQQYHNKLTSPVEENKEVPVFREYQQKQKDLEQYASGYAFGYRVRDFHTGNDFGHTQNRNTDGVTRGEYHILLPDGRTQTVKYTADEKGFHADVNYNNPISSRLSSQLQASPSSSLSS